MLSKLVNEAWKHLRRGERAQPQARRAHREQLAQARRLLEQGELGSAHDICAALLAADPGLADAWNVLGGIAFKQRDFALAARHFAEAIAQAPERADLHNNYGYAMAEQFRIGEAVAAFRRAVEIDPRDPSAHPNLLWLMNMRPEFSAEERYREHCRWAESLAGTRRLPGHGHDRDPERALRIGYVSSDFRNHAVGHFIEPILAHHVKARFAAHCYSNSGERDAATERMRALAGGWRDIAGLSDDGVEALVREDRIDILIDLSGHTRGNRLRVFARRPAPVQVTFLGYPATTGMSAIDYRLTDALAD
ncbi:MAG: tetratricopeptide repeat protein, partial [Betaproteobacteria bacterium]|nr:tetratricopeptide repeat protein [Betaproteobacteria bacterium]